MPRTCSGKARKKLSRKMILLKCWENWKFWHNEDSTNWIERKWMVWWLESWFWRFKKVLVCFDSKYNLFKSHLAWNEREYLTNISDNNWHWKAWKREYFKYFVQRRRCCCHRGETLLKFIENFVDFIEKFNIFKESCWCWIHETYLSVTLLQPALKQLREIFSNDIVNYVSTLIEEQSTKAHWEQLPFKTWSKLSKMNTHVLLRLNTYLSAL